MTTALRDWIHSLTEIGPDGLSRTRAATAEECIELARELDVLSVEGLTSTYDIKPLSGGRYKFSGTLEAAVTQACVVSLDPVPARIEEAFAITLAPADSLADEAPVAGDREVSSIPDTAPIVDGRIDAGSLIYEVLSAALDPYPRKAGVTFDWSDPRDEGDGVAAGPFAALAKLKRDT